ncbi:MAG: polysaccharide biosynthesis protein [Vicinamibacterales bacterium]
MARDLIRLSGCVPDEEIQITFVGLRPGEKLYEELVATSEISGPSEIDKIMRVRSRTPPDPAFLDRLDVLEEHAAAGDNAAVLRSLRTLIPEYSNLASGEPAATVAAAGQGAAVTTPAVEEEDSVYQLCPECKAARVRRSKARSLIERVRRDFGQERLFRCDGCGWRGWLLPLVFSDAEPLQGMSAPDLDGLDRDDVATAPAPPRPSFAPRHLR